MMSSDLPNVLTVILQKLEQAIAALERIATAMEQAVAEEEDDEDS